ncbi:hypothetical protein [Aquipuribacter hungaricus]|uniref:Uncharacterized protein n=1 Tax=Aquipuribacter hungaricus TaxID=545624 RepID=A0ABV7WGR6_9MICO
MAFTDLPDDPQDLPLSDPAYTADVLDLVVPERDRHRGAIAVLLCDDEDRLLVPAIVGELPDDLSEAERETALRSLVAAADERGSVLVAVARRQGLSIRPGDQAWRRAATTACAEGPRLIGVYVITPEGSRAVPAEPA